MEKPSVQDVLTNIYENDVSEDILRKLPKDALADFILEIFNKGILNGYLTLRD